MKQDKQKTKVLFLIEMCTKNDVFAYFPNEIFSTDEGKVFYTCYAPIGQHSACRPDYAKECIKATPDQYNDLKIELESIGYNLEILN